jgi:hypothetical protein
MKTKASHLRVVAIGAPPSSDPVYPAIERYERANAIYNQVLSRERFGDRSVEWEKEEGEACARWNEARDEMWTSFLIFARLSASVWTPVENSRPVTWHLITSTPMRRPTWLFFVLRLPPPHQYVWQSPASYQRP